MKRAGAIRDDAKVEALKGQLDTIREQRNQALKQHDTETTQLKDKAQTAIDAATKAEAEPLRINQMRRDLREQLVQRDADRRGIHEQFDEQPIQSALKHELSLAPALGKDYGHAQLWEPGQISRDHESVRNFLMDALKVQPDESWLLDAHGLTSKELEKLGTTDPARRLDIMREWTGEEHEYHLRQLKNSLEDAKQREKLAKLDLNDTLRDLGVLKSGERQVEVREYGRYRDMLNAEVVAVRGERDRLRLEEQSLVEAATAARQQGLDRLQALEPGATTTNAFSAQAARAQEVAGQLSKAETRLSDLLDRQLRAERAFEDARDMRVRRKSARQAVQDASRDIAAQQELSAKNTGQVKRAVRTAGKRAPMDEAIDDILTNLMYKGSIPASALDAVVPEPGRFKARRLNLTPEQKIEAGRRGWLRTDLPNIIRAQDNQIAGHLGLREALDYGPGKTFESWGDVEDRIRSDYRRLADKTPAKRGKLENESDAALKDLNGLKARLLNQVDPGGDKEGWLLWAQKQMRQYNFIRYAQGMLPSSIPDMGAFALQHRVAPMLAAHAKEATHMAFLGDLTPKHNTELRRLLSASEIAIHGSLLSERMNDDQLFRPHGIGAPGSLKNQITSRVDKAGEAMSHYAGRLSGLPQWDRFWKILSGLQMSHDLRDQVGRYAELSDQERTHLAGLGVGEAEAGRLQKFIEAHGETDSESGLWDPKLENWYGSEQGPAGGSGFPGRDPTGYEPFAVLAWDR
jgi:hypothetical protein